MIAQGHTGSPRQRYTNFSIVQKVFAMKYKDYERVFSPARLNKYLGACRGNALTALTLYRYNIKLCQKFYGILNIFEILLRNAINNHYQDYFSDPNWIRDQFGEGGLLEKHPQRSIVEKMIIDLVMTGRYSNDRVVSSVSLGFWTYLFTKLPFKLGGKTILKIFPNKTKGLGQRAIYNELQAIKAFRNRIAHHEAICFDNTGRKSTLLAKENYELIIKYVRFLGYPEARLYYGLDVLPDKVLQKIDSL